MDAGDKAPFFSKTDIWFDLVAGWWSCWLQVTLGTRVAVSFSISIGEVLSCETFFLFFPTLVSLHKLQQPGWAFLLCCQPASGLVSVQSTALDQTTLCSWHRACSEPVLRVSPCHYSWELMQHWICAHFVCWRNYWRIIWRGCWLALCSFLCHRLIWLGWNGIRCLWVRCSSHRCVIMFGGMLWFPLLFCWFPFASWFCQPWIPSWSRVITPSLLLEIRYRRFPSVDLLMEASKDDELHNYLALTSCRLRVEGWSFKCTTALCIFELQRRRTPVQGRPVPPLYCPQ